MDDVALVPYLTILNSLPTAVWVYDQRTKAMVWGNVKALDVWEVHSQEELRKQRFNWLSEATNKLMVSIVFFICIPAFSFSFIMHALHVPTHVHVVLYYLGQVLSRL